MLNSRYSQCRMSYCINPNCSNRQNPDDLEVCQTCGTKLLINERYQIIRPLRTGQDYNSEIFEVKDFNERKTVKVLKSLALRYNNSQVAELFKKEAQFLIWLSSEWHNHPGIPQVNPEGYFTFGIGNGFRELKCLVMEKIEGQNLEQWIGENQPISQDRALNWLQQLVKILQKVHSQGLWHRDIKPSNIMLKPDGQLVLIDFGAVGVGETRICSTNYTPQEQMEGRTVLQSDFFALGRTFVYLLTGKHPWELHENSTTKQLIWRYLAPVISSNLAQLIDDLMAPVPENRPQNNQEILRRIQEINNIDELETPVHNTVSLINSEASEITQIPSHRINLISSETPDVTQIPSNRINLINSETPEITQIPTNTTKQPRKFLVKVLWVGGATLLLGLAGTIIYQVLPCEVLGNFKPCLAASSEHLSFGEKILIPGSVPPKKQWGVEAFRDGKYSKAVDLLEKGRNDEKSDPETLIYLNNARIEAQKTKSYTIAVATPLNKSSEALNSGLEILRGVAQAQDEFNHEKKGVGIKVLIVDDANNSERAKQIAEALVNQEEVLAVVGHFTSDSTLAAAEVYQQNQLVFVSPTSTSEDLSAQAKTHEPNFFFRTVPSDRVTAETLARYLSKQNQQTAAVFYNPKSRYSDSLREQFRKSFSTNGREVIELDLSPPFFNVDKAIDKAKKQGAKVLALFPNSQSSILNKTRKLINTNECGYSLVGGDTIYTPDILKEVGKEATKCLVVAVPWHSSRSPNLEFPQAAETLWGGRVSWRTALTYDATRVLLAALEKTSAPTRSQLQQTLSNSNFQATGATGRISFERHGDRKEGQIQLIQVQPAKPGQSEFDLLSRIP